MQEHKLCKLGILTTWDFFFLYTNIMGINVITILDFQGSIWTSHFSAWSELQQTTFMNFKNKRHMLVLCCTFYDHHMIITCTQAHMYTYTLRDPTFDCEIAPLRGSSESRPRSLTFPVLLPLKTIWYLWLEDWFIGTILLNNTIFGYES